MKNGNFDFFVMTLQTSCGAFHQRERVTLQTSCGAFHQRERVTLQTSRGAERVKTECLPQTTHSLHPLCVSGDVDVIN